MVFARVVATSPSSNLTPDGERSHHGVNAVNGSPCSPGTREETDKEDEEDEEDEDSESDEETDRLRRKSYAKAEQEGLVNVLPYLTSSPSYNMEHCRPAISSGEKQMGVYNISSSKLIYQGR
jgi:hypothetical protein